MSGINKKYLNAVVAIGVENREDSKEIIWIGTGFLVGFRRNEKTEVFLLTNKHVIERQKTVIIRFNKLDGTAANDFPLGLRTKEGNSKYSEHPSGSVDVVAVKLNSEFLAQTASDYQFFDIDSESLSLSQMQDENMNEGSLVYALGFPMNLVGKDRQYPICRLGCISRISDAFEFSNAADFLVDAQTFPGNSGGPIVVRTEETIGNPQTVKLIGILSAYIPYREPLYSMQTGQQRSLMEENSGLTVVHPVDRIREVVGIEYHKFQLATASRKRKAPPTPNKEK